MIPDQQTGRRTETPPRISADRREIDSRFLLRGARTIVIRHGIDAYRLSLTAAGKLLLTK